MRGRSLSAGRLFKRGRQWSLDYRGADGRRHIVALSTDKHVAERARIEIVRRRDMERCGLLDDLGQDLRLHELVDAFLLDLRVRVSPRHFKMVAARLRRMTEQLGDPRVRDIKPTDVTRLRAEHLARGSSPRTSNLLGDSLSAACRWAVDARMIAQHPLRGLRRLPERGHERRRRRALSEAEVGRFLQAAADDDARCAPMHEVEDRTRVPQAVLFRTLIETGIRFGEARTLAWADLDLERRLLIVKAEHAKSKRLRAVPLAAALAHELRALRVLHERVLGRLPTAGDRVFLAPDGRPHGAATTNLMRTFRRVLQNAGIVRVDSQGQSLDLHALRATCATRLARSGAPLVATQRILGHSDPKLTARHYLLVETEDLRAAVEGVAGPAGRVAAVESA